MALTGKHANGENIYGPRPSAEAMQARAKRDGVDFSRLVPAIQHVCRLGGGSSYWVETWARPQEDGSAWMYRLRRDGRVELGTVAYPAGSWEARPAEA